MAKSDSSDYGWLQLTDLGSLKQFLAEIARAQKRLSDRLFRFTEMDGTGGEFWLFEDEDDDEIVGAVLQVQADRVYALSQDVYRLVTDSLFREK